MTKIFSIRYPLAIFLALAILLPPQARPEAATNKQIQDYCNQASDYASQKDYRRAIECLIKAQALAPDQETIKKGLAVYYNDWAIQLANEGELDAARERFEKAVSYDAQNKLIKTNLSYLFIKKAQEEYKKGYANSALAMMEEAIKTDPANVDAYIRIGDICYDQDDFTRAASSWREALRLKPGNKGVKDRLKKLKIPLHPR